MRDMCQPPIGDAPRKREQGPPGLALALLMERELGLVPGHLDGVALRLFLIAYRNRVSALVHQIHEEESVKSNG
jgi:hypothetical protein